VLVVLWQFQVREEHCAEFERLYGAEGAWAKLFRQDPAYVRTELFRHAERPGVYLSMDRWYSRAAYARFRADHAAAYQALDDLGEQLTESEALVGMLETSETG